MKYQDTNSPSSNNLESSNQLTEQIDYAIHGTDSNQTGPLGEEDEPETIIELPPQTVHNVDISYQKDDGTMGTISTTVPDDHELTKEELHQIINDYNRINNYTSLLAEHPEANTEKWLYDLKGVLIATRFFSETISMQGVKKYTF